MFNVQCASTVRRCCESKLHATEASVDRFHENVYIVMVNYVSYVAQDVNIFHLNNNQACVWLRTTGRVKSSA